MRTIRVYPLFFVVVLALVIIPVHAANPQYDRSITVADCSTSTCTSPSIAVATGDTILFHSVCSFSSAGDLTTPTDSLGNSYSLIRHIGTATFTEDVFVATSVGGNAITVSTTSNGGACHDLSFSVVIYSFVASIGAAGQNTGGSSSASGSDTLTITIASNSIIFETFNEQVGSTLSGSTGQSTRELYSFPTQLQQIIMDRFYSNGGAIASTANWSGASGNTAFQHIVIELQASGGSPQGGLGTLTACYGNCGNPAITLANTNSTHTINFNNSITLFYQFQSNLNGYILNETVNVAKTYTNGEQVGLGIYTATCPSGTSPFTSSCPGQQRAVTISNPNPSKGKFTLTPSPIPVSSGQWVGIAVTAIYAGLDLNDTNTSVSIFQQSPGTIPPQLNNGAPFNTASKIGMWTYITGNTITAPPPIGGSQGCGADILCTMNASACGLTPTNCIVGALIWGLFWAIITIATLEVLLVKVGMPTGLPGGIYILIFISWMTIWSLVVGAIWFIILEILAVIWMFTSSIVGMASGTHRGGATA